MRRNRDETPGTVDDERQALFEQRRALEALKEQLAERVAAVQEREAELREAIAQARAGTLPAGLSALPLPAPDDVRTQALDARQRTLDELAAALAAREAELDRRARGSAGAGSLPDDVEAVRAELARREAELQRREQELARAAAVEALPPAQVDLEARLAELRTAEQAFLRTREELSARAEAVAAREQLVADRERELRQAENALPGDDLHDLEARLRRLESQRVAAAAQSFSGGIRRLGRDGTRGPRA